MSEAYKQLSESEIKYRTLFKSAYDAILLFENKTVKDCNPRTLELFECTKEDILKNPISMLWPKIQGDNRSSLNTAEDIIIKALQGKPQNFEWQYQKFNGEIIDTEVSLSLIDLSGRKLILAIVRNITQRKQAEKNIIQLNEELEDRVERRTIELTKTNFSLQKTIEQLKETQAQLVESEKMAALGGLVAGISHEINTPVGIGVTAASHLKDQTDKTVEVFSTGSIKKSQLANYFTTAQESSQLILSNLIRADGFKQAAVDQSCEKIRTINFKDYLHEILKSMQHKFKKTNHVVKIECPENFEIRSYPGAYY